MLYEDFWKSSCDWKKTTIYRSVTNTIENRRSGRRQWLSRKQMLPIFDPDEGIVEGCRKGTRTRAPAMILMILAVTKVQTVMMMKVARRKRNPRPRERKRHHEGI